MKSALQFEEEVVSLLHTRIVSIENTCRLRLDMPDLTVESLYQLAVQGKDDMERLAADVCIDPSNFRDAVSCTDSKHWEDSMLKEITDLFRLGTFSVVSRSEL